MQRVLGLPCCIVPGTQRSMRWGAIRHVKVHPDACGPEAGRRVRKLLGEVCGNGWEVCVGIAGGCVWELSQVMRAVKRGVYQIRGL